MDRTPHILVVDDNREIRELLARYLGKHELRVSVAADGDATRRILKTAAIDLVVLDLMLPGESGFALCSMLSAANIPVVMLTAVAEEADRVMGLELGADDYLTKPFSPRELLARIRAVLRRAGAARSAAGGRRKRMAFGSWVLDLAHRDLTGADGVGLALSAAEFRLLQAFVERPGVVLTRDQLLDITAGRAAEAFDRSIDNMISRLRKKIEDDPKNPRLIKTAWGEGYALSVPVTELDEA